MPGSPRSLRPPSRPGSGSLLGRWLVACLGLAAVACRADAPRAPGTGTGAPASETPASEAPDPGDPAPRTVRVALCQIGAEGDLERGLASVDRALARAASEGAELACFPEACLLGWVNPEAHDRAHPIPGPTVERLGELARRHGLGVAIGLAERDGPHLHNSVVLLDRDGTLLLRHRKVNVLEDLMDPPYTPGVDARDSVVETRWGRVGLLICADTFEDALVGQVAEDDPDLVLVPYGWAAPAEAWPEHGESLHAWIAHSALRTGAPVVGVDAVGTLSHGPWAGMVLGGQSAVGEPSGQVRLRLADRERRVWVVDVELPAPTRD